MICINFNSSYQFVTINDVLGDNGVDIISKVIQEQIIKNSDNVQFSGIDNEQNFFVENDCIVIVFNKHELSAVSEDILKFKMPINSIANTKLSKANYYTKEPYNLKMIPIRTICDQLGFKMKWDSQTQIIDITNGSLYTYLIIGKNTYFKDKTLSKQLESEPEIRNGTTYAPISFFKEYLNMFYTVYENGDILFSVYND